MKEVKTYNQLSKERDIIFNKLTKDWDIKKIILLNTLIDLEIRLEEFCNV